MSALEPQRPVIGQLPHARMRARDRGVKRFVFTLVALVLMAASAARGQEAPQNLVLYKPPKPLPDLQFLDAAEKPITLSALRGKVVVLNLWATWCIPCRKEMPTLDDLQAKLGGPNFEVVALSIDRAGLSAVGPFFEKLGIKHLAKYTDPSGATVEDLGAVGLPTTLLIDRQGQQAGLLIGPAEWNSPEMIAFLQGFIVGKSAQ